jgi:hypothetical protein
MTVAKARNIAPSRRSQVKSRTPDAPKPRRCPAAGATTIEPNVVDNLPEVIPVTVPELDVIETYLGGLIDGLLTNTGSEAAGAPSSTSNPGMPIRASRPRS